MDYYLIPLEELSLIACSRHTDPSRSDGGNPCGYPFLVAGVGTYVLLGCGGNTFHLELNGRRLEASYVLKTFQCLGGASIQQIWSLPST